MIHLLSSKKKKKCVEYQRTIFSQPTNNLVLTDFVVVNKGKEIHSVDWKVLSVIQLKAKWFCWIYSTNLCALKRTSLDILCRHFYRMKNRHRRIKQRVSRQWNRHEALSIEHRWKREALQIYQSVRHYL